MFAQGDWGVSPGPQVDARRRKTALQDLGRGERSGSPQGKEKKNPPKVAGFQSSSNFMQIYSNYYRLIFFS